MHDGHASAGAADGHVQASMATFDVDRSESVGHYSGCCRRPVTDAQDDVIAFVALDVLQVLDEEALVRLLRESLVEPPIRESSQIYQLLDEVGLRARQGNH